MTNLVWGCIASFLLGWVCGYIRIAISREWQRYKDNMEKLKEYERKAHACPHGHEDWGECPDCGH